MIAAAIPRKGNPPPFCFTNSSCLRKSHLGFQSPVLLFAFSTSVKGQKAYDFLVEKHHFPPQSASHIASVVPRLRNPARSDSLLYFLKQSGFSNSQLEKALRLWPRLLCCSVEKTVEPRIKIFQDVGLSATDIAEMLSTSPWILRRSIDRIILPSLTLQKTLFGAHVMAQVLKSSSANWLFTANISKILVPNIELLKKCGVSVDQIALTFQRCPSSMLCRPDKVKKFVDKADQLGASRSSKLFIYAVTAISQMSDETLEFKLRTLREIGFLEDDIAEIFRTSPMVLQCSAESIKETVQVILSNGEYDLSCITRSPICLGYSTTKRYKPRLRVLELLEGKNLIHRWPALGSLATMTDKKFYEKYVAPFADEIGDVYAVEKAASV